MLQFKMNHKWTRVLTHVKDRKHLSSKRIFCLSIVLNIRFYIYKMVLYYYNTIFQKNTMSKDLCYLKSSLVWGGWGIFPSFIHDVICSVIFDWGQIKCNANARFLEGEKSFISACCCGWMKGICDVLHCHLFHLVSLVHRKTLYSWIYKWLDYAKCDSNSDEFTFWIMSLLNESFIIIILRNWNSPNMGKLVHHISGCD